MRITTILGARPQFIKAAAVSRVLALHGMAETLVHTGQHYDDNMSDQFFRELTIPAPAHHLGIGSGPHGLQTGRMLEAIEATLLSDLPERVLVYGDTNSTLAGALAAAKLHIPVAHVEAGLRSFNRAMPEEINRIMADHLSTLLFAPTRTATANLQREGIGEGKVYLVGDVMYDVARYFSRRAEAESTVLERLGVEPGGYVLATVHRAENTDAPQRLRAIFAGLQAVAVECPVVLPLHPRTRVALAREGLQAGPGLLLTEPVGYLDMARLEHNARVVATDSGGVQKEAFFHGVPCITLRDETEWVELVEAGWNRLLPPVEAESVVAGLRAALAAGPPPGPPPELYGSGDAAEKIVAVLMGNTS